MMPATIVFFKNVVIYLIFFGKLFIWLLWSCVMQNLFLQCMDSLVVGQRLSHCGTRALLLHGIWDLNSSTKDQTQVLSIARGILNHWTTREVPIDVFFFFFLLLYNIVLCE